LNSSVAAVAGSPGYPPKAKAAALVPAPAKDCLAVVKFVLLIQVDPSYSSVAPVSAVEYPPKPIATV
jgi:hypothetical protein